MKSKYWPYLFFTDLLAELIAINMQWQQLRWFTKPLLVVLLFIWLLTTSNRLMPLRYYLAAALFFSWLGDVFLLNKGVAWFMAGLAGFLLAHIMYILFFLRVRKLQAAKTARNFYITVVVAVYAVSLFAFLSPHIGSLQLPVGIYACTIATMLVTAIHAFGSHYRQAAFYCIAGAVLFLVSDSLLAINKFYHPFLLADTFVMLSYGLAQFAIIKGSLLYLSNGKSLQEA